jgi:hypothetical protein
VVNNSVTINHAGDAFVDDSQIGCTAELPNGHSTPGSIGEMRAVVRKLKHMVQSWECLLFITDGALNLQKSFWILLTWQWRKGTAKLSTTSQEPAHPSLTTGYGREPVQIPRLDPSEGFRTVFISPRGSTKLAQAKLKLISVEYATALTGSRLNCSTALWSYLLYLIPKLTYSTPALTLMEQECH